MNFYIKIHFNYEMDNLDFRIKNVPELAAEKLHTKQWKYCKDQKQQKYQSQNRIHWIH